METQRQKITARIRELQDALKDQIDERRADFRYRVERRRVVFEEDMRQSHREARESLRSFLSRARPMVIVTAPVIYSLIIPIALLDLFVSVYQAICFPIYGIPKVRRSDYIAIDRQHLAYLNGLQKINCTYCGYCNGLIEYVREVAGRTEQYWCPIKHSRRLADTHQRYNQFTDFGDAEAYHATWMQLRKELANDQPANDP